MKYIFFSLLLPFYLTSFAKSTLALEYKPGYSSNYDFASNSSGENFYTKASQLVQQQIDLIARIEQALIDPDANRLRAVRGQSIVQTKTVDGFLNRQYKSPMTLCVPRVDLSASPLPNQLTQSQAQIYCSLYTSNQELSKLSPVLNRLLSRRGELGLVRQLPLVTGERQFDPVLSIAPIQHPNLSQVATPFSTREPNISMDALATEQQFTEISSPSAIVARTAKTAIANYTPPLQPAIAAPKEALTILANAKQILIATQQAFPPETKFTDPQETAVRLDRFAYDLDPQESQTYAKFLGLPDTGIFRVLHSSAYQRPLNTLQNRLQPNVSQRYPFPLLGNAGGEFNPSLALELVGDRFQLRHQGVDYSFMVDVGDVPLEQLDGKLQTLASPTRQFFLNYQPPKQLNALQVEKRRFLTGKDQNWNQSQTILADATAELNHTYLVRSLQFQVPKTIAIGQPISQQERPYYLDQLQQIQSSDTIVAFRAVRRRSDVTYTVLWRILDRLPAPQFVDVE
ncbi:hypothetical protein I8752_08935 [Nostocaceae cyanobacterium CENA369]|uniref:Uncharacterized protein n=1 Tax=Dendronalium phyllosphericum CENA369 TaxID=1725256 RepID=A0A8J7I319_9NOST|nr:hypothetical protein [Dendronalium phyllosphericum]MBH8573138.1 hypothetical protein [Dendronalium phyllosphericum CENA369]